MLNKAYIQKYQENTEKHLENEWINISKHEHYQLLNPNQI